MDTSTQESFNFYGAALATQQNGTNGPYGGTVGYCVLQLQYKESKNGPGMETHNDDYGQDH